MITDSWPGQARTLFGDHERFDVVKAEWLPVKSMDAQKLHAAIDDFFKKQTK